MGQSGAGYLVSVCDARAYGHVRDEIAGASLARAPGRVVSMLSPRRQPGTRSWV